MGTAECPAELAPGTNKPQSLLLAMAVQMGVRELRQEGVLGRYLREEISREEAVQAVGVDLLDLAERQPKAMLQDLAWATDVE